MLLTKFLRNSDSCLICTYFRNPVPVVDRLRAADFISVREWTTNFRKIEQQLINLPFFTYSSCSGHCAQASGLVYFSGVCQLRNLVFTRLFLQTSDWCFRTFVRGCQIAVDLEQVRTTNFGKNERTAASISLRNHPSYSIARR